MKIPALQNKQVGVLRMAFRIRKVFGTFEKHPHSRSILRALSAYDNSGRAGFRVDKCCLDRDPTCVLALDNLGAQLQGRWRRQRGSQKK